MTRRRHKGDTRTFGELTYEEQAKSITASINNLQNAIMHHIKHAAASRRDQTREKVPWSSESLSWQADRPYVGRRVNALVAN
jgi:hypothetical protein